MILAENKQKTRESARCRNVFAPDRDGSVNNRFPVMGLRLTGLQRTHGNFPKEKINSKHLPNPENTSAG